MPLRLLTPDAQYLDDGVVERAAAGPDVALDIFREADPEKLPKAALDAADGVIVWHEIAVDPGFVARLPRCRIIVRAGVGYDHIDLAAAGRAGIPVCNTPDYGTSEVADHAMALMLALCRGIVTYHEGLVADPVGNFVTRFDPANTPVVRRLRGLVLGIVGLGRIGIATALRAKAFGMRVVAYDPYAPAGTEIAVGVERRMKLDAVLAESDIVSLHCPLTAETRGMIGTAAFAAMKPGAVLVNTARGAIVDIPAMLAALESGRLAGAGIDVLPVEPPRAEDRIVAAYRDLAATPFRGRLILTPHAAWSSPESVRDARRLAIETALLYLRDGRLRNHVNGAELATPRPPG